MKPADGSFTFSQRINFFLPHNPAVWLTIASWCRLSSLAWYKTHTINSQKKMAKVTEKDKIHQSKYCCDNEDPENRKDEHKTLSWGNQPQWTIHRELHTAGLCIQLVCWFHLLPLDSCCPILSLCIINYCRHWKPAMVTSNQHIALCLLRKMCPAFTLPPASSWLEVNVFLTVLKRCSWLSPFCKTYFA